MDDSEPNPPPAAAITRLELAQAPAKEMILRMLDQLRAETERGEIITLVALTIRPGEAFDVSSAGEVRLTTLAGMLGRAHLDALQAIEG
jgi:hypothetical protein